MVKVQPRATFDSSDFILVVVTLSLDSKVGTGSCVSALCVCVCFSLCVCGALTGQCIVKSHTGTPELPHRGA